jgi:hypothetical protein
VLILASEPLSVRLQQGDIERLQLYAAEGQSLNLRYEIGKHDVLVRAIDLRRHWRQISDDLLALIADLTWKPQLPSLSRIGVSLTTRCTAGTSGTS